MPARRCSDLAASARIPSTAGTANLIVLDGKAYQVRDDGKVREDGSGRTTTSWGSRQGFQQRDSGWKAPEAMSQERWIPGRNPNFSRAGFTHS
jgi:hypothetical protein